MAYEIVWTENAESTYSDIVHYLAEEWSVDIASKFIDNVESKLLLLSQFPHIGRKSLKRSQVRKYPISRQNMLVYQLIGETILILYIYDTRQNPDSHRF